MIVLFEWILFLILEAYWLRGEKRKMYLYKLWIDVR